MTFALVTIDLDRVEKLSNKLALCGLAGALNGVLGGLITGACASTVAHGWRNMGVFSPQVALVTACSLNFLGTLGVAYFCRYFDRHPIADKTPMELVCEYEEIRGWPKTPAPKPLHEGISIANCMAYIASASVVGCELASVMLK